MRLPSYKTCRHRTLFFKSIPTYLSLSILLAFELMGSTLGACANASRCYSPLSEVVNSILNPFKTNSSSGIPFWKLLFVLLHSRNRTQVLTERTEGGKNRRGWKKREQRDSKKKALTLTKVLYVGAVSLTQLPSVEEHSNEEKSSRKGNKAL